MLLTILLFVVVLGLLVFVHELGHFVIAKKSGMQVDEFGFGFPPRVFGVQKVSGEWKLVMGPKNTEGSETVYSINLIPLGGFVKIAGENNDEPDNPKSFTKKPFLPRLLTLLAGVLMNVFLAWVLISVSLGLGSPTSYSDESEIPFGGKVENVRVTIVEVRQDSPAKLAGLKVGDGVVKIGDSQVSSIAEMQGLIGASEGLPVDVMISRGGQESVVQVVPELSEESGRYTAGVVISLVGNLKYPWYQAPIVGLQNTWYSLRAVVTGLGSVFTGQVGLDQLGGPAKIAQLTGEASKLGLPYLLQFTAFLSLNLAVLNALPIPALDGGRVLFLVIEKLRRKPNNQKFEQLVNVTGFFLLLLLMLVVTVNDIKGFGGLGSIVSRIF